MQQNKKSRISFDIAKGLLASICGWFFGIIFGLGFIGVCVTPDQVDGATKFMMFIFLIFNIYLIAYGRKMKQRVNRFRNYTKIITNGNETNVENIAGILSKSTDFVMKDLKDMIRRKYFINAYIDKDTHELVFNNVTKTQKTVEVHYEVNDNKGSEKVTRVVECKCCGAKNQVVNNEPKECEYCGSYIDLK